MSVHRSGRLFLYLLIPLLGLFYPWCAFLAGGEGNNPPGISGAAAQETFSRGEYGTVPGRETGINRKTFPVVVYFGTDDGYLVPVREETIGAPAVARAALRQLCRGPSPDSGLVRTMPPGTVLRNIRIKDGLATVDFSRELKSGQSGGATDELLTVYSIVDTLTQFPTVHRVQILVEGKRLQTLAGHLDIGGPLRRDESMLADDLR